MLKLSSLVFSLVMFGLVSNGQMSPTVVIIEPTEELVAGTAAENADDAETMKTANNFGIGYYPYMPRMYDGIYGLPRPFYASYDNYGYGSYSEYSRYNGYKTYSSIGTPLIYRRPAYTYWR